MSDNVKKLQHPNSLKNLSSAWNSETAKDAQLLGAKKRTANALAREQLKISVQEWKLYKEEVLESEGMSSLDILKILMHKSLESGDYDTAADLAKSIAEFEQPKLSRVEQKVEEVSATEMTDDELAAAIKRLSA